MTAAPAAGPRATRVAAFDCGTNSLRLLLADVDPVAGSFTELDRRMEIVRLGQGVDRTGRIDAGAMARALAVTRDYAALCRDAGAERIRFVATSASRDAENTADFTAGVRDALGVDPEVVTGAEEAELSFDGATRRLAGRHPGPFLVVDLGGGSTELVLGDPRDGGVLAARSVDVGCVRLAERHLAADPPAPGAREVALRDVEAALDLAEQVVPLGRARTLVGLAGTVTTVTAQALGLDRYDRDAIHGATLPVDRVLAAAEQLERMSRAERAALPFMHPGRVDVIGAGALVWQQVVRRVDAAVRAAGAGPIDVVASEHDILDGIAWSLA
jgi:exopolyphosphatase / guanosine-5'-triphosphate,3'-diphosphate pyrophosphatase